MLRKLKYLGVGLLCLFALAAPMTMNQTPHASISVEGNAVETAIATAGTFVQVTVFDTNLPSNGTTPDHTQDHITIVQPGNYLMSWGATTSSAGNADVMALRIEKNNGATTITGTTGTRKMGAGGDVGRMASSVTASFVAGDTVEMWVSNETDTDNLTIEDVAFTVVRLGP